MNKKSLVTAFAAIALTFLVSGCGTTRKLLSITPSSAALTGASGPTIAHSRNLFGIGGAEQIFIIANFTGGNAQEDVTRNTTFVSSNPSVVTVDGAGIITAVSGFCSWADATTIIAGQQIIITATFETQTTQVFVNVNSVAGCPGPTTQQ